MMGMSHHTTVNLQPGWFAFQFTLQGHPFSQTLSIKLWNMNQAIITRPGINLFGFALFSKRPKIGLFIMKAPPQGNRKACLRGRDESCPHTH